MKIALCQINTVTGNIRFNTGRIVQELENAARKGADLAIFHEMTITGYPPKDLLEYNWFTREAMQSLSQVQAASDQFGIACLLGAIHTNVFGGKKELLNAAACISPGEGVRFGFKKLLPTYDVFDEHRYFQACPADTQPLVLRYDRETLESAQDSATGVRLGVSICEDIWNDNEFWQDERLYPFDPIEKIVQAGANVIINISASPFVLGKPHRRLEVLRHTARRWNTPVLLVNQVGGCDQIIFDGGSCVIMPDGTIPCSAGWFRESTVIWDTEASCRVSDPSLTEGYIDEEAASVHDALLLGLRDYLRKTGFTQVIVGNSGGIDSATVLTLSAEGLGRENVISVSMPGPFTSPETRADSAEIARRLGVRHLEIPIVDIFRQYQGVLESPGSPVLKELFENDRTLICKLADENNQARIRGNILMWISNAIVEPKALVLSTGNKSEQAAGYCTLYGDMAGGLSLISDVPKMLVYKLARHLNRKLGDVIPQSIIDREPTAELAPNQKDSDSLPPYPVLDEIIRLFIEERKGCDEIAQAGVAPSDLVLRVVRMIENAEYKRAQAAPGLKVTSKAFGFGRRMPIARG